MEEQARWMVSSDLVPKKKTRNFLGLIHVDDLEAVQPGSITLLR
jgi:hypothetical protein